MKYILAEKLIAEIERRKQIHKNNIENGFPDEANKITEDNDILYLIRTLRQEQPGVDLEEEIEKGWEELEKDYSPSALDKSYIIVSGLAGEKQFSRIARHFYELGLNAKKEE